MTDKADPCGEGLTPECFKTQPQQAKQLLAYRVLGLLLGFEYLKRLQTFKGLPLPVDMATEMGIPPSLVIPPAVYSAIPPILISMGEPGPIRTAQAEEEEIIMAEIRRAKIDFSGAEDAEIVAAVAGQKISVAAMALTVGGETNLTFKSDTTAISGAMDFGGTDEPRGFTHGFGDYPLQTAGGEAFVITSSIAVQVSGYITYYLEAE